MKTLAFIQKCISAVPVAETWGSVESYGVTSRAHWPKQIKKVLYCVNGSEQIDQYASAKGYDAVIQHHPMYTDNRFPTLTFHTALDCCKGGLNDMWAEALGVKKIRHIDQHLGWVGRFDRPMTFGTLMAKVEKFIGQKIVGTWACEEGFSKQIKTISICTGLGGMITNLVKPHRADCYLTGELTHSDQTGVAPAVIETGHTLSERCGYRFFEKLLKKDGVRVDLCPLELDVFGNESSLGREAGRKVEAGRRSSIDRGTNDSYFGSEDSRQDELDERNGEFLEDVKVAIGLEGNRNKQNGEFDGEPQERDFWEPERDDDEDYGDAYFDGLSVDSLIPKPERWCQHGVNTNKFECFECPKDFAEKTDK